VNYSRLIEERRESGLHPTMKPVALIENEMLISSNPESAVVDLFGGSGSTLIACEKTNRKCFMMELDPRYTSIIIERWCKYTGDEAYLLNEDGTKTSWTEIKARDR
jgi:DNA modification methylase